MQRQQVGENETLWENCIRLQGGGGRLLQWGRAHERQLKKNERNKRGIGEEIRWRDMERERERSWKRDWKRERLEVRESERECEREKYGP